MKRTLTMAVYFSSISEKTRRLSSKPTAYRKLACTSARLRRESCLPLRCSFSTGPHSNNLGFVWTTQSIWNEHDKCPPTRSCDRRGKMHHSTQLYAFAAASSSRCVRSPNRRQIPLGVWCCVDCTFPKLHHVRRSFPERVCTITKQEADTARSSALRRSHLPQSYTTRCEYEHH